MKPDGISPETKTHPDNVLPETESHSFTHTQQKQLYRIYPKCFNHIGKFKD